MSLDDIKKHQQKIENIANLKGYMIEQLRIVEEAQETKAQIIELTRIQGGLRFALDLGIIDLDTYYFLLNTINRIIDELEDFNRPLALLEIKNLMGHIGKLKLEEIRK